ncbi:synaptotagmin 17, partial [Plakobranchus ocellatus]
MLTKVCEYMSQCPCCCCWADKKEAVPVQKITIQHTCMEQSHGARLDSTSSNTESVRSYRERVDSDNSRTDSVSSASGISVDSKRHVTPIIDMKPIEFWTANRESVQPRSKRGRHQSESEISVENFQRELYELDPTDEEPPCLTDEEKLAQFQLGQLHFGLKYDVASKTTVQRKTQEPVWNECFDFDIDYAEAQERTLEILLKDFDKYSRHRLIGRVLLPLNSVNLVKGGHMWKPLSPGDKECVDLGELLLSINYLPSAGRLTVDVIKAKGLIQTDIVGGS